MVFCPEALLGRRKQACWLSSVEKVMTGLRRDDRLPLGVITWNFLMISRFIRMQQIKITKIRNHCDGSFFYLVLYLTFASCNLVYL